MLVEGGEAPVPVAFVREDGPRYRVLVAGLPFHIGRAADSNLVLADTRLKPWHAVVRMARGEYVITAAKGCVVRVNGRSVPFFALQPGDRVSFTAAGDGPVLRFQNRMADSFVPPGASFAEGWMAHPAFAAARGPLRYGEGRELKGSRHRRSWRVSDPETGADLAVKVLGRVRSTEDGDHYHRLISTLAGSRHPHIGSVVDGGLAPFEGHPTRWMALTWVDGTPLEEVIPQEGSLWPSSAILILRGLAGGLAHLHARGVVHGDVSPANVVVGRKNHAVLIDPGQAVLVDVPRAAPVGVIGTPGFVAPEAVLAGMAQPTPAADVYGLAALAYALLTGRPPAAGGDVLETLAQAGATPTRPSDLGVDLPAGLEDVLMHALNRDPGVRPRAPQLVRVLTRAATELGLAEES